MTNDLRNIGRYIETAVGQAKTCKETASLTTEHALADTVHKLALIARSLHQQLCEIERSRHA